MRHESCNDRSTVWGDHTVCDIYKGKENKTPRKWFIEWFRSLLFDCTRRQQTKYKLSHLKVGFTNDESQSGRKSAYYQVKIKDRSRKRSHKLDGIGVGRIRTFQFSSDSAYDSVAYDPVKYRLSESEAEAEEPTNHKAWIRALWLVYSFASASDSDNAVISE